MDLESLIHNEKIIKCQEEILYQFKNPSLLLESLWHSSQKNLTNFSYDRMEFVGDAILRFYVSVKLYNAYPNFQEGDLTKATSNIVSAKSLASISKKLNLDKYIFIAPQANALTPDSILSDVYESLIAAIFFDGGIEKANEFINRTIEDLFLSPLDSTINHKAILSEWAQKNKIPLPKYEVIEQIGPAHDLQFKMIIHINDLTFGPIIDRSKKEAEQKVAQLAILKLNIAP